MSIAVRELALTLTSVSGGGKTSVLNFLAGLRPDLFVSSAGGLIQRIREGVLQSGVARERAKITEEGNFLEDHDIEIILDEELRRNQSCQKFILDGYVRSTGQLDLLMKRFGVVAFLVIDTDPEVAKSRILQASDRSNRPDDEPAKIDRRHALYEQLVVPAVRYAEQLGYTGQIRFKRINGNLSKDAVAREVMDVLPWLLGESPREAARFA